MSARAADAASILPLLAWLSPAFPVGAYAYSHGMESAVDAGMVHDATSLRAWIVDLMEHGSARQDTVLAAAAWRAVSIRDDVAIGDLNDLALALAPSRERRLETAGMGTAFAEAIRVAWPEASWTALPHGGDIAYPVAFGAAAGTARLPLRPSLEAFGLAFVQNLVSAAVRLGAIGQTDGQRVTAALIEPARVLGQWSETASMDDLGTCAFRSDIASLQHETLYSRLFRS